MSESRRLLVIAADPDGPVVRYRILAYLQALAAAGVLLEVVPWPRGYFARRAVFARAEATGAAWVVGRLLRRADVNALRKRVRRLFFDFDDAMPFHDSSDGATPSDARGRRFKAVVRAADAVSAGNEYLAGLAREAGANAVVLPTTVEVEEGTATPEPRQPPFVLGWVGSASTVPYLQAKTAVFAAVVSMGIPFRLRVIADVFPTFPPGIAIDRVPWSREGENEALDGMHAGIAPLSDDPWTRGKCGLKILQMMARGRPVVASAVGVQRDQVRDGATGFLASTDAQMVEAIVRLARDGDLRRRMGGAARQYVRECWSVEGWRDRVVDHVTKGLS